jgi:hypothetical protein
MSQFLTTILGDHEVYLCMPVSFEHSTERE